MPALLKRTSSRPKAARVASNRWRTESASPTSVGTTSPRAGSSPDSCSAASSRSLRRPGQHDRVAPPQQRDRDPFADSRARAGDEGNLEWIGHARNGNMPAHERTRHRRRRLPRHPRHQGAARQHRRRPPVSRIVAADIVPCPIADPRVDSRTGTIADPAFIRSIVEPDVDVVFHLAAVLSGQSEAEFDWACRSTSMRRANLLEACRALRTAAALRVLEHGGRLRRRPAGRWCPRTACCGRSPHTARRRR